MHDMAGRSRRPGTPPCTGCRTGQRACQWSTCSSKICIRCERLGKECSGPVVSIPVIVNPPTSSSRRLGYPSAPPPNLSPSSRANTLGESTMTAALTYELIHVYQNHLRSLPDLDPDLEPFRQRALNFKGLVASGGLEEDELHILTFMAAGTRLSKHSAVVGSLPRGTLVPPSDTQTQWPPDRLDVGLARERIVQALSAKLIPKLYDLVNRLSVANVSDSLVLMWMAIDNLGIFEDLQERHRLVADIYGTSRAFVNSACPPDVRIEVFKAMDSVFARSPGVSYLGCLEDVGDQNATPPILFRGFAATVPTARLHILSHDDLDRLFVDLAFSTPNGDFLQSIQSPLIARLKSFIYQLANTPQSSTQRTLQYPSQMEEAQTYLANGITQTLDYWRTYFPDSTRLPRGPIRFLRALFRLGATHLICVWTAHREALKVGAQVNELTSKLDKALSIWSDYVCILMENVDDASPESYELSSLVTQTLDFIKSSSFMDWAASRPPRAYRLIKYLEYASFSHASASRLVYDLRGKLEGYHSRAATFYPTPSPEVPAQSKEGSSHDQWMASLMVSKVVNMMSEVEDGGRPNRNLKRRYYA